jgi:hypothetical protein
LPPQLVEEPQVYLKVRFELEQELIDSNADVFEKYATENG